MSAVCDEKRGTQTNCTKWYSDVRTAAFRAKCAIRESLGFNLVAKPTYCLNKLLVERLVYFGA